MPPPDPVSPPDPVPPSGSEPPSGLGASSGSVPPEPVPPDPGAPRGRRGTRPRRATDPETTARDICLRLLSAAPRTRAQLADALRRKNIPDDVAERVLGRFTDVGLIDDEAFARAWVQSRHTGRGLARRALAQELRHRGVADDTVDDAVASLDPAQEEQTARALVARRLPATRGLDTAKRVRRLVGMLARKGYPPGLSYRVVKEALADEGADLDDLPASLD
ncbi:MAG TPA: recombination regulator RecX [Spirillospora sp.]